MSLNQRQSKIILAILKNGALSSSDIHQKLLEQGDKLALVTVKRALSDMVARNLLIISGVGPATTYHVSVVGRLFLSIEESSYCAIEPDKRFGSDSYNFKLFQTIPKEIFDKQELKTLEIATKEYKRRTKNTSAVIQKKELERFVIELAWKSSKIEGNTYTLLDTEKLILENKRAPGHNEEEAQMILNHKEAFNFIWQNSSFFKELTRANLEKLHSILVKGLSVNSGLREKPVGVIGSKYQPLANGFQIKEAVENLSTAIKRVRTAYAKSLISLLGISYIQPFEDGNKRAARLMANALLISHNLAPLSYRSIDESEYRKAIIVFYEINSLIAFKNMFINQYKFAALNYAV
jgi:Fic family protein